MPEVSGFLASACPVARYIDDVIHWLVQFSLVLFLFSPPPHPPHLSLGFVLVVAVFFSPLMFLSVTGGPVPFLLCGGSWLSCIVVPAKGALFQATGWLPIVEAPGYSRHPTSTLAMQLLTSG